MNIGHAIALNVVGIIALAALIGFFAKEGMRLIVAGVVAFWAFDLSLISWLIFIVLHFVTKYW